MMARYVLYKKCDEFFSELRRMPSSLWVPGMAPPPGWGEHSCPPPLCAAAAGKCFFPPGSVYFLPYLLPLTSHIHQLWVFSDLCCYPTWHLGLGEACGGNVGSAAVQPWVELQLRATPETSEASSLASLTIRLFLS